MSKYGKSNRVRRTYVATAALATVAVTGCAQESGTGAGAADDFPSKPISIVVPFSAGGGTDLTARGLDGPAEEACGTDITVSNVEGGAGAVGMEQVAEANNDGYTLGVATSSTMMGAHYGTSQVTPDRFRGIMHYNLDFVALSVAANSPYKTIDDFLAAAENGEELTVATSGAGSITELAFMGMTDAAGVPKLTNVPFDGGSAAITAVMGNQADAVSATAGEQFQQIDSGKLRPLVSMSDERLDFLPDTPTLQEKGIDWSLGVWRGLVAPADTPDDVVDHLSECFGEAIEDEEFQAFMEKQNFDVVFMGADEWDTYLNDEFERYGETIERMGLSSGE